MEGQIGSIEDRLVFVKATGTTETVYRDSIFRHREIEQTVPKGYETEIGQYATCGLTLAFVDARMDYYVGPNIPQAITVLENAGYKPGHLEQIPHVDGSFIHEKYSDLLRESRLLQDEINAAKRKTALGLKDVRTTQLSLDYTL